MRICWLYVCLLGLCVGAEQPNIVLIIADDLGWNDVGFHGMTQIPTPNIDALAWGGAVLQRYYVNPICTPSRSALMTGKYAHRLGMQHKVLYGMEPRGLPLSEKLLPQYMKELGYKTHLVGKWHLGSYKRDYLPLNRGFDSHVGFWTGRIDMFDHTNMEKNSWGFDFRRGYEVAHDYFGKYVTDIYTEEAEKVIRSHNASSPLFLVVGHSAVHSGNPPEPIRAPDDVIARFAHIDDFQRRKFAAVLSKLDESVGRVISSLQARGLLANSVILFTTDNGGCPAGFNDNAGSNYPLRGTKATFWEGGTRGAAVLFSPLLKTRSFVAHQLLHITDWLPTLVGVAGGNVRCGCASLQDIGLPKLHQLSRSSASLIQPLPATFFGSLLQGIDGVDQWAALSHNKRSGRTKVAYNFDSVDGTAAVSVDDWKLVTGRDYEGQWDGWYGPDGYEGTYDTELVYTSPAGKAIGELNLMPPKHNVPELRKAAKLTCNESLPIIPCHANLKPCLFNLAEDACERRNLADEQPKILESLLQELSTVNKTAIPPSNLAMDSQGDPKYWGRVYMNFGDFERTNNNNPCI